MSANKLEEKLGMAVLGQHLTEWPDGLTYRQILDRIYDNEFEGENDDGSDSITAWEPYEDWDGRYLFDVIKDIVDASVDAVETL